jgi:hypothetical protein
MMTVYFLAKIDAASLYIRRAHFSQKMKLPSYNGLKERSEDGQSKRWQAIL